MKKSVYLFSLIALCSLFSISAKAQAPVITTDPSDTTVCTGTTTLFGIMETGATSYIWELSTDGGANWDTVFNGATYSGADGDTLQIITSLPLNGGMYRCLAFNTNGSDTSLVGMLGVDGTTAGTITAPGHVCIGVATTFTSSVSGGVWSNVNHAIDTTTPTGDVTGLMYGQDSVVYTLVNTCGTYVAKVGIWVDTVLINKPITGPNAVCVGNVITLMNANTTGIWSVSGSSVSLSSTTVPSITVTGVTAGSATVSYTVTNACNTIIATKFMNAETMPTAGTITGSSNVCAGSWILLTSSVSGGTWISGTTSVAVVASSGFVTGLDHGTSVISYYLSNSCGSAHATFTVTVDEPVFSITGNDSVGIDSTIVLADVIPGGTWSSADASIATVGSTGVVTGIATGATTITYSVTNTCGTSYATAPINVGPLPYVAAIGGPDSVCVGATITLTDSVSGGVWTSKHDTLATISGTGVVTGIEYGMDTIYYTVTTAFGTTKKMKKVFVNQPPVITITGPAGVSYGAGYTLVGSPAGGTWATNNPGMGYFVSYGHFVVLDTGTTVFTYTTSNTCGPSSGTFTVHLPGGGASGVNGVAVNTDKLSVFPNPTTGNVKINITTALNEEVAVTLADAAGRVVKQFSVMSNTLTDVVVGQPAGVYMLTATTKNGNRHTARISVTN